jgi:pimeloyl-ACP methyl ester carboxylesterase
MNGEYVSGDARLSFCDAGEGLPVVLLHPTPLDRDYWRPLTRELAGIRAVVPDLRGHGCSELGSGLPTGGFANVPSAPVLTMAQLATDVLALLFLADARSADTCSWSCGGGRRTACAE